MDNLQNSVLKKGLKLDVSFAESALTGGSDLVTGGDMSDAADWTAGSGWDVNSTEAGKAYTDGTTGTDISQTGITTADSYYVASFVIGDATAGTIAGRFRGSPSTSAILNFSAEGSYTVVYKAADTGVSIVVLGTNTATWTVDNVVVREIDQATYERISGNSVTASNVHPAPDHKGGGAKYYSFDGTDDLITVADANAIDFGTGDFSLIQRVRITTKTGAFFSKRTSDSDAASGWALYPNLSTGVLRTLVYPAAGVVVGDIGTTDLSDGEWYTVAATFDRDGNAIGYVDGIQEGTLDISGRPESISTATDLRIGKSYGTTPAFTTGDIACSYLFNYALEAADVLTYSTKIANNTFLLPEADQGADNSQLTSGTVETGKVYIINTYNATDDFTNIGGTNVTGNVFTATGTTPTDWTNSSILIELGSTLSLPSVWQKPTAWHDWYHDEIYTVDGPTMYRNSWSNALWFDGADSYLMATDATVDLTGNIIIWNWFNLSGDGEDVANGGYILNDTKLIYSWSGSADYLYISRDGSGTSYTNTGEFELNTWYFVATVSAADGTTAIYKGTKTVAPTDVTDDTSAGTPEDGGDLYFGDRAIGGRAFNGAMTEPVIVNRDLITISDADYIRLLWDSTK